MNLPRATSLTVIYFKRDPGNWVAQCLEYDIGAQANTRADLSYEFQKSIVGHILICAKHGATPFESLPPAPSLYWHMRRSRLVEERPPQFDLPPEVTRPPIEQTGYLVEA